MKLQILIPQYEETDEIISPLLDSIKLQQNINMNDIGVIIVNDGSDVKLSDELLGSYPFSIEYFQADHKGVSATRNYCLDKATADYVMFCDADDIFFNACGLYIVFREIQNGGFDGLISCFVEETRDPKTKEPVYINHNIDSTFVHGKIYNREFLIKNKIRWNNKLKIHEDSYFNILCQNLSVVLKHCPNSFYLWKWRDESVCRHDPKYILKTYKNMLESNTELVKEFKRRGMYDKAMYYSTMMIYDAYFTMNKKEWLDQDNQKYRKIVEKRFKKYYLEFDSLFEAIGEEEKSQIIVGLKNRMFGEGMFLEEITFKEWIKNILKEE